MKKKTCTCLRCGASWERRTKNPVQCPRCKSTFWNKPRRLLSLIKSSSERT